MRQPKLTHEKHIAPIVAKQNPDIVQKVYAGTEHMYFYHKEKNAKIMIIIKTSKHKEAQIPIDRTE